MGLTLTFPDLDSIPLGLALPPTLFLGFVGLYTALSPYFHTDKQRAYILSTCSSLTMSLISLPYITQYLYAGLEDVFEKAQEGWRLELGKFGVLFFGTYLFADLAIGYLRYRSQVGLLTGWIHHIVYIILMIYLYNTRLSPIFLVSAIMELPTFDLAISNLFPILRSDLRFLSSFFIIRIAFHLVWLLDCLRPSSRAITDGSYVPASMLTAALILHASWFRGGLMGYLKRQRLSRKSIRSSTTSISTEKEILPIINESTDLPSLESNQTISGPLLLTPPTSPTPEDSPLITPYTPSTTPMTLRDSYIYTTVTAVSATLPTISIPSIPSLSDFPSIPSLSDFTAAFPPMPRPNMGGREFKDAVKIRWEEGRGRFGNMNMGLGGMGLGGMGPMLRRRAGRGGVGTGIPPPGAGVEQSAGGI